jgi:hypothetical protein
MGLGCPMIAASAVQMALEVQKRYRAISFERMRQNVQGDVWRC